MHGYLEVDVVKKKLEPWLQGKITLLTAQWVDMGALENRNHASLSCFFSTLDLMIYRIGSERYLQQSNFTE